MKLKKSRQDTLRFLGHFLSYSVFTFLCKSLKIEKVNVDILKKLKSESKPYVIAFWHGTMLLPWFLHGNPNVAALTSKSKDGDLLAKLLKKWKYKVVRGSSSSGGETALGVMVDYAKNNFSIAITPDGPRGPHHKFKAGAVVTAKKSGLPIILAGVGHKKKKILNNWDEFEIPYFFTKTNVVYSDPVYVSANLSYDETSEIISFCEKELNRLQKEAQKF
ncbi:MAG: lysophospholipid acyltransferase family protein [Ignavibacteriaceae bacterium]|nr:lysophospholipid acyltransferase family protein [Ignavibacteriaceae bacterium]